MELGEVRGVESLVAEHPVDGEVLLRLELVPAHAPQHARHSTPPQTAAILRSPTSNRIVPLLPNPDPTIPM